MFSNTGLKYVCILCIIILVTLLIDNLISKILAQYQEDFYDKVISKFITNSNSLKSYNETLEEYSKKKHINKFILKHYIPYDKSLIEISGSIEKHLTEEEQNRLIKRIEGE